MDSTQAVILTTIFNVVFTGIVGGIVVYTLQKKIDATIQKSLFEHQTKFARNFPKTLEVLEVLHQKFRSFILVYLQTVDQFKNLVPGKISISLEEFYTYRNRLMNAALDCDYHVGANRMYLSDESVNELESIMRKAQTLSIYLENFGFVFRDERSSHNNYLQTLLAEERLPYAAEFRRNGLFQNINLEQENAPIFFLEAIGAETHGLLLQLEKLYRSVADAQ
jgi:hypothetical protein